MMFLMKIITNMRMMVVVMRMTMVMIKITEYGASTTGFSIERTNGPISRKHQIQFAIATQFASMASLLFSPKNEIVKG